MLCDAVCCSHHCCRAVVITVVVLHLLLSSLLPAPPQPSKRLSKYTYTRAREREPIDVFLCVSIHTPACLRRLERRLGVYVVGTGKSRGTKERLDV